MKFVNLDLIPPGNPFKYDLYHTGERIGTSAIYVMFDYTYKYIIIVDSRTGQRTRVEFEECTSKVNLSNYVNDILHEEENKGYTTFENLFVHERLED